MLPLTLLVLYGILRWADGYDCSEDMGFNNNGRD